MDIMLLLKRALIFGVSAGVALVITLFTVFVVLSTDIETYSVTYFILTWIPIGALFVIWADALLGTRILPD